MDFTELPSFHCQPFPFHVYLCLSEDEWDEVKGSINCTHEHWTYTGAACCRSVPNGVVISLDYKIAPDETEMRIFGHAVHECVHAFQALCELIGETNPSDEFEAYTIQHMAMMVVEACQERRSADDEKQSDFESKLASGTQ